MKKLYFMYAEAKNNAQPNSQAVDISEIVEIDPADLTPERIKEIGKEIAAVKYQCDISGGCRWEVVIKAFNPVN